MKTSYKVFVFLLVLLLSACLPDDIKEGTGNSSNDGTGEFTVKGVTFKMVNVAGGTFTMGATFEQNSYEEKELPTHQVTLDDFQIGETEVTQELWEAVMGNNPSYMKGYYLPVTNVDYDDIQDFLSRLNKATGEQFSLPTEAEWEYAARGGKYANAYRFSGANEPGEVAWYSWNSYDNIQPVGGKKPNELGIYDMSGNVFEMCNDWMFAYSNASQYNPIGGNGTILYNDNYNANKVVKGGSKGSEYDDIRIAVRSGNMLKDQYSDCGFRLALNSSALKTPYATAEVEMLSNTSVKVHIWINNTDTYSFLADQSSASVYEMETSETTSVKTKSGIKLDSVATAKLMATKSSEEYDVTFDDLQPGKNYAILFWLQTSGGHISIPLTKFVMGEEEEPGTEQKIFDCKGVIFHMVKVKGGTFSMGATTEQGSADEDELPVHDVTLKDYYIGETEVTQQLWNSIMGSNSSDQQGNNLPVTNVSYQEVQQFIDKLNTVLREKFSLPTEAEWEYAARGGVSSQNYRYSGGDIASFVGWYKNNSGSEIHPVATCRANELGIYDMSGNVFEFCKDWMFSYAEGPQQNPIGAEGGTIYHRAYEASRIIRGGCYTSELDGIRVASRFGAHPSTRYKDCGFRLALESSALQMPEAAVRFENITSSSAEAVVKISNIDAYSFLYSESSASAYEMIGTKATTTVKSGITLIPGNGLQLLSQSGNEYRFALSDLKAGTDYAVLFWLSCTGGNFSLPLTEFSTEPEQDIWLYLMASNPLRLGNRPGIEQIPVNTNYEGWTVECPDSWCTVTKMSSNDKIKVVCENNPYPEVRNTTIIVRAGSKVERLSVVQNAANYGDVSINTCDSRIKLTITDCIRNGTMVTFNYSITNIGFPSGISDFRVQGMDGVYSQVIDNKGNSYTYKNCTFRFNGETNSGNFISGSLPYNVKVNASITLTGVGSDVTDLSYIKVHCYPYPTSNYDFFSEYFYFQNVPIY